MMQSKVIWLTGGSGSGKSTVSAYLRSLGLFVVDCDKIARDILQPGKPAYFETVEKFGYGFLQPDGEIDRRKLGEAVFSDTEKLHVLNAITHKYIKKELMQYAESADGAIVFDAPLPPDGFIKCDKVLLITAPPDVRVKRICERDGISEEQAKSRISSQNDEDYYIKIADVVFINDGDISEVENKVKKWCIDEKII